MAITQENELHLTYSEMKVSRLTSVLLNLKYIYDDKNWHLKFYTISLNGIASSMCILKVYPKVLWHRFTFCLFGSKIL